MHNLILHDSFFIYKPARLGLYNECNLTKLIVSLFIINNLNPKVGMMNLIEMTPSACVPETRTKNSCSTRRIKQISQDLPRTQIIYYETDSLK